MKTNLLKRKERIESQPADGWVEIGGLSIHYKCEGTGNPVLLLHGGGNDWHEWQQNLPVLASHFRIYALDLPGFGMSEAPDFPVSLNWYVEFLKSYCDKLGLIRFDMIAHSMGALLAIIFAVNYSYYLNKLVLIDASGMGKLSKKGHFLVNFFRILDHLLKKRRGPRYISGSVDDWLVINQLNKIKSPVLLIWGQKDLYLPVEHAQVARSLIPDCQLYIFPDCGHAPQRENPAEFNRLVLEFLK